MKPYQLVVPVAALASAACPGPELESDNTSAGPRDDCETWWPPDEPCVDGELMTGRGCELVCIKPHSPLDFPLSTEQTRDLRGTVTRDEYCGEAYADPNFSGVQTPLFVGSQSLRSVYAFSLKNPRVGSVAVRPGCEVQVEGFDGDDFFLRASFAGGYSADASIQDVRYLHCSCRANPNVVIAAAATGSSSRDSNLPLFEGTAVTIGQHLQNAITELHFFVPGGLVLGRGETHDAILVRPTSSDLLQVDADERAGMKTLTAMKVRTPASGCGVNP